MAGAATSRVDNYFDLLLILDFGVIIWKLIQRVAAQYPITIRRYPKSRKALWLRRGVKSLLNNPALEMNLRVAPQIASVTFSKRSTPKNQSAKRKLRPKERRNLDKMPIMPFKIPIRLLRNEGGDISKTSRI